MGRGRPRGTLSGKYTDENGKPIGVFEWRKKNKNLVNLGVHNRAKVLRLIQQELIPVEQKEKKIEKFLSNDEMINSFIEQLERLTREQTAMLNFLKSIIVNRANKNIRENMSREEKITKFYKLTIEEYNLITSKCSICGFNTIGCDLHHIDGNKYNNDRNNLIGLCRNCHLCVHRGVLNVNGEEVE